MTTVNVDSTAQEVTLAELSGLPNGNCTLGEAILSVNNLAVGAATIDGCIGAISGEMLPYEIVLAPDTRYTLTEVAAETFFGAADLQTTGLPAITAALTIAAPAADQRATIERAAGADRFGLLASLGGVQITTRNIIFANGDTERGGAFRSSGTLFSDTTLWRDNQAEVGGAIDGFSVSMIDSELTNNRAVNAGAVNAIGMQLTNTVFNANEATDSGGAVMVRGALFINGAEFNNNTAIQGGAVRVLRGFSSRIWSDAIFRDNHSSSGAGGAVLVDTEVDSVFTLERCTFLRNSAATDGGAMAINHMATAQMPGIVSVTESVFEDNVAGDFGGALSISSAANPSQIGLTQSEFRRNQADNGGAISALESNLELAQGVFVGNSASVAGGAIWSQGSQWESSINRFVDNVAPEAGAWDYNGTSNAFISTGDEFVGNQATASHAGALFIRGDTDMNVVQATFTANQASGHGGAIYHSGVGLLQLQRSTLNQNQAGGDGGAAFNASVGIIQLQHSELDQNQATNGGAIGGGEIVLEDSWLHNNVALGDGGALATTFTETLMVSRSTLSGNSAINGGAVSATSRIELTRSTVFNNRASGLGGGLYLPGFQLAARDATLINNPAGANTCTLESVEAIFTNTIALGSDASSCPCTIINGPNLVYCGSQPAGAADTILELTLRDNGGPTPTLLPLTAGPAVNSGEPNFGGDIDQRGFARIVDGVIDIGAVELGAGVLFGLGDQPFSNSFEDAGETDLRRWTDRDAFLNETGATDAVGSLAPAGNLGQVSAQRGSITYTYFGASGLNIGCQWSNLMPDNGSASCEDLALNGPEDLDLTTDAPVNALGFDFVDPNGDGSVFEITVCASAFDANDTFQNNLPRRCPVADTLDIFRFNAPDNQRYFVGVSSDQAIRQVSIRDLSSSSANEYFGHVYTSSQ